MARLWTGLGSGLSWCSVLVDNALESEDWNIPFLLVLVPASVNMKNDIGHGSLVAQSLADRAAMYLLAKVADDYSFKIFPFQQHLLWSHSGRVANCSQ